MIGKLLQLVRSWFDVDRIRISPTEGRLLGLKVDQRIVLRNRVYRVLSRTQRDGVEHRQVFFQLADEQGCFRLQIQLSDDGQCVGARLRTEDGCWTEVFDDDVQELTCPRHSA